MNLSLRKSVIWTLVYSLIMSGVPLQSFAAPASEKTLNEIKDNFELMTPVRRGEKFTELYYRMETRLSETQKQEFADLNKQLKYEIPKLKTPEIKATADSVTIKEGAQELVIKIQKNKEGEIFITANGQKVSEEIAQSPIKSFEFLKKITAADKGKTSASLFWNLFVPKAQAFSWGPLLSGALGIGVIGYALYQKHQASIPACKKESATCCNINSVETQLSDGCCSGAGGFKTGAATCMPKMYIDGATTTVPSITPVNSENSSTGVK